MPGPVPRAVSSVDLVDAQANQHVEVFADELVDHAWGTAGIVCRIAIDQHVDVSVDVGEHPPHDVPLSLPAFGADFGPGGQPCGGSAVGRIVVVNIDCCRGERFLEAADHSRNCCLFIETRNEHRNSHRRQRHLEIHSSATMNSLPITMLESVIMLQPDGCQELKERHTRGYLLKPPPTVQIRHRSAYRLASASTLRTDHYQRKATAGP